MTSDGKGCGGLPKHWMDSGPAALARARELFSASRSTTTGRAAVADGNAEARGEAEAFAGDAEGLGNHFGAQTLGKSHGAGGSARGQGDKKFIHARPAQHVVAAQQGRAWPPNILATGWYRWEWIPGAWILYY